MALQQIVRRGLPMDITNIGSASSANVMVAHPFPVVPALTQYISANLAPRSQDAFAYSLKDFLGPGRLPISIRMKDYRSPGTPRRRGGGPASFGIGSPGARRRCPPGREAEVATGHGEVGKVCQVWSPRGVRGAMYRTSERVESGGSFPGWRIGIGSARLWNPDPVRLPRGTRGIRSLRAARPCRALRRGSIHGARSIACECRHPRWPRSAPPAAQRSWPG